VVFTRVKRGKDSALPCAAATHPRASGQTGQRGVRGVQTVAPSSIIAWLWSPGWARSSSVCAAGANALAARLPSG
jgi:hypothetical protein